MSGYRQAARIRNFCSKTACPDKCNNGLQYIDTVCSDPLAIGTNCCNTYKVYINRLNAALYDTGQRIPLFLNSDMTTLIGFTYATSTDIYASPENNGTTVVGSLVASYRVLYNVPKTSYVSGDEITYTGIAKVSGNFSIMFIDNYPSGTSPTDFKASVDAQLEYYQPVNQAIGPLALSLSTKAFATNGQLLRKKVFGTFTAKSNNVSVDQMQEISLFLSDDI